MEPTVGMPPKLLQEIQNGVGAAIAGQLCQIQLSVGPDAKSLKTIRILIFPELEEKTKCGNPVLL